MEGMIVAAAQDSWHPIGQTSNQLILYHPPSHALSVQPRPEPTETFGAFLSTPNEAGPSRRRISRPPLLLPYRSPTPGIPTPSPQICPYCSQPILGVSSSEDPFIDDDEPPTWGSTSTNGFKNTRSQSLAATPYFQILERAHEGSRPPSPRRRDIREMSATPDIIGSPMPNISIAESPEISAQAQAQEEEDVPAKGYYERYFQEEAKLGMGAEGSVYLATHVIGQYAVKKIAVGTSKEYLVRMLREVRLLEALRHPNIIPYHHSWIDVTRFSNFGPPILALHVLMMYATAGNLDTFLLTRSHATQSTRPDLSANEIGDADSLGQLPKAERIKAFKKRRQSGVGGNTKVAENRGVLLLGLEEIAKLFGDVVEGLAFLHANSILHLDLKCSNVLLHWEEGKLIPKAMISDFGTSEEMLRGKRERTGHTGTMEYMAPETLAMDINGQYRPSDSHADMWSLGMILHKLLFLHLPYPDTEDFDTLHAAILSYAGFIPTTDLIRSCERRHIPRDLLLLLSKLVHIVPENRPSAEKIKLALRGMESKMAETLRSNGATSVSNSAGALIMRVTRPFGDIASNILRGSSQAPEDSASRTNDWQNDVSYAPVRPVLALFSPTLDDGDHHITLMTPTVDKAQYFLGKTFVWRWRALRRHIYKIISSNGRAIVFVIKIISLQPRISGIDLHPVLVIILVILAFVDLSAKFGSYRILAASMVLHFGIMFARRSSSGVEDLVGDDGILAVSRAG